MLFGFDAFSPGELAAHRALLVDTHQEEPEIRARAREMERRGLGVEPGRFIWWWAAGLDPVSSPDARAAIKARVEATGMNLL